MAELCAIIESTARAEGAALMGVVNVTPDSFSDGGRFLEASAAKSHVDGLLAAGALIIDVGGESSRPGAEPVAPVEQIRRVGPALDHAVRRGALVSIDTTSPEVAEFALRRGARIVNDISCLADPELARITARYDAAIVVTHSRGPMAKMAGFSRWPEGDYGDVVEDVKAEWSAVRDRAIAQGVRPEYVFCDPGFGFSKSARHTLELLGRLRELGAMGALLVVGPGRKSFISAVDPSGPGDRLGGTIAASILAAQRGAHVLRVHDVREVRQALAVMRSATATPPPELRGV
ncbi:MAG TPA: dihydropteroate synthase [Polyangiaceae bacterium]|nr:dihydropteroate synthase [Polyangiaceae bacterium]